MKLIDINIVFTNFYFFITDLIVNDNFNPNFNWDEVTRKVSGKSFKEVQ